MLLHAGGGRTARIYEGSGVQRHVHISRVKGRKRIFWVKVFTAPSHTLLLPVNLKLYNLSCMHVLFKAAPLRNDYKTGDSKGG